jgi:alpha-2-macroglobulin
VQSRADTGASTSVSGGAVEFSEMREDRVLIYTTAGTSLQTFTYKIRATNSGEFTVPPAYGESMYESDIKARSLAGKITVTSATSK